MIERFWNFIIFAGAWLAASPALAQVGKRGSDAWAKPVTDTIVDIEAGGFAIGIGILGVMMIIGAIWAAAAGRMDWNRMVTIVIAGVIMMFGAGMLQVLLG